MGHEPVLIPDYTLFIQLGIFMASYLVMRTFVFMPFMELLHLRESKTTGLAEKAKNSEANAEKLQKEYESAMASERKVVAKWLEDEKRKVSEEERKILDTARERASKEMEAIRLKAQEEASQAEKELLPKVEEFASAMSSQILGYSVKVKTASSPPPEGSQLQDRA